MTAPRMRPTSTNCGPLFNERVDQNGYLWFYIDAISEDGSHGLTIIAFVGCVFSPFYAAARRLNGGAEPLNHCAINVALYGGLDGQPAQHDHYWAMTECNRSNTTLSPTTFAVAKSQLHWDGKRLVIDIDEVAIPFPAPTRVQAPFAKALRGQVIIEPEAVFTDAFSLDHEGLHQWRPIAPLSRVAVKMTSPDLQWQGTCYVDSNRGSAPLEDGFHGWDWSRTQSHATRNPGSYQVASTEVIYDVKRRDGTSLCLAKAFTVSAKGATVTDFAVPPRAKLKSSGWGIARATACDAKHKCQVVKTVEDTPFYARSIVHTSLNGAKATMFHESLSLKRFSARWVQMLLPFKMRRLK